jgi:hypothetical protein
MLFILVSGGNGKRYLYTVRYLIITKLVCASVPSLPLPEERIYVEQCIF